MFFGLPLRRRFSELSEAEVLALAIYSEEDDARIYATYAEQLREAYPGSHLQRDQWASISEAPTFGQHSDHRSIAFVLGLLGFHGG